MSYQKKNLTNNEYHYDQVYAVLKDKNDTFKAITFDCEITGINGKLLSLISNNLESVKIKFLNKK